MSAPCLASKHLASSAPRRSTRSLRQGAPQSDRDLPEFLGAPSTREHATRSTARLQLQNGNEVRSRGEERTRASTVTKLRCAFVSRCAIYKAALSMRACSAPGPPKSGRCLQRQVDGPAAARRRPPTTARALTAACAAAPAQRVPGAPLPLRSNRSQAGAPVRRTTERSRQKLPLRSCVRAFLLQFRQPELVKRRGEHYDVVHQNLCANLQRRVAVSALYCAWRHEGTCLLFASLGLHLLELSGRLQRRMRSARVRTAVAVRKPRA